MTSSLTWWTEIERMVRLEKEKMMTPQKRLAKKWTLNPWQSFHRIFEWAFHRRTSSWPLHVRPSHWRSFLIVSFPCASAFQSTWRPSSLVFSKTCLGQPTNSRMINASGDTASNANTWEKKGLPTQQKKKTQSNLFFRGIQKI